MNADERLALAEFCDKDPSPLNVALYHDAILRDVDAAIDRFPGPEAPLEGRERALSAMLCSLAFGAHQNRPTSAHLN